MFGGVVKVFVGGLMELISLLMLVIIGFMVGVVVVI